MKIPSYKAIPISQAALALAVGGLLVAQSWILASPAAKAGAKTEKKITVYRVEQVSQIEGPITLYFGSAGIKMLCPIQHLVCVSSPPKWDVQMINEKEHLGMVVSSENWIWKGFRLVDKVLDSQEKSRVSTTWRGMPAESIVRTVPTSDPVKEQVEMLYRDSAGRATEFKSEEFLCEKFLNVDPHIRNFFIGIYRVPHFTGLLLRRTRKYPNGRVDAALDTLKFSQTQVPVSVFDYAKDFKPAKSINQLCGQKEKTKRAADLLEDMFLDKK